MGKRENSVKTRRVLLMYQKRSVSKHILVISSSVNKRLDTFLREANAKREEREESVAYWKQEYKRLYQSQLVQSVLHERNIVLPKKENCLRHVAKTGHHGRSILDDSTLGS